MFALCLSQIGFALNMGYGAKANRANRIEGAVVILAVWKPLRRPICRDHGTKTSIEILSTSTAHKRLRTVVGKDSRLEGRPGGKAQPLAQSRIPEK
jgi:hypothetical protein